jgi:hypothetical protein
MARHAASKENGLVRRLSFLLSLVSTLHASAYAAPVSLRGEAHAAMAIPAFGQSAVVQPLLWWLHDLWRRLTHLVPEFTIHF